jgi:hypothetical protein
VVETKFFLWFLKLSLKLVTFLAFFTALGIMFQLSMTRLEKKFLSYLQPGCFLRSRNFILQKWAAFLGAIFWLSLDPDPLMNPLNPSPTRILAI